MANNFAEAMQQGYAFGADQRREREAEQRRTGLASLAQQAYAAPPAQRQALVSQAIGLDPEAGFGLDKTLQGNEDRRQKHLVQLAKGWKQITDPTQRQRYYEQFVHPAVSQMGFGDLGQYDEAEVNGVADQILAAYGGGKFQNPYDGLPADIQSLRLLQDSPELAALDKERRQYSGMIPKLVETQQGIGWGTPGGGIRLAPLEGVAGGGQQQSVQAPQLFAALGQKYGIQPTSVTRTPEKNRQVGGVRNSYHLSGQAADFVVPQQFKAQFVADARANGFEAIDEGDHVHIEPATGGGASPVAQPYEKPKDAPKPTALEDRIRLARELGASEDEIKRIVMGGDSARDAQRISAKDATTARQKLTQIKSARQQLLAARQAFDRLKGSFSAGLGGQYLPTPEGQAFDRAIANLAPLLTAVTRVPGIGAMSDYESRLQNASLPSRGTYEDVTVQQFEDLARLFDTVEQGYTELLSGGQAAPNASDEADDLDSLLELYR